VSQMRGLSRSLTRIARRYLVGPEQSWVFTPPAKGWQPPRLERTSLYLHVPFCRNCCPYCPYTKVPYDEALVEPYTQAALAEVDRWAEALQPPGGTTEITSIYIGGGTPTLALGSMQAILERARQRFRLTGDVCIETNPNDVNEDTVRQLQDAGVALVSLGVQSFQEKNLKVIGRRYDPSTAVRALKLLTTSGFASVNADLMFALPGQTREEVLADLQRAADLGVNQITTYPLFTFPYTSVGEYLHLKGVRMPELRVRREHYRAINDWCAGAGFGRVSVWGFKRGDVPRYSSVTRDGYIGIGPGSGSHLPDGFTLNTFDLKSWIEALQAGRAPTALRMPFAGEMAGWWWLYWRFYDTHIPLPGVDVYLGKDAPKARFWLSLVEKLGWASRRTGMMELNEKGAFWLHLVQNHFALTYVNTIWTQARREPFPQRIPI